MGSFNHKGNLSNLPIEVGDSIVVLIGLREDVLDRYGLGFSFTPISLPIHGRYNDYGGIEDVERTPSIELIEKMFDTTIETIVDLCADSEYRDKDDNSLYKNIMDKLSFTNNIHYLGYFMEHESVFNKMVDMSNVSRAYHKEWGSNEWYKNFLKEIGYEMTTIDDKKHIWKHSEYPIIYERDHYFFEDDNFCGNYEYPMCIGEVCKIIGIDIPEKYNQSWLEWKFEQDMNNYIEEPKLPTFDSSIVQGSDIKTGFDLYFNNLEKFREYVKDTYFINSTDAYGFFHGSSYFRGEHFVELLDTIHNKHLTEEFKPEFIKFAAFIDCMESMNLTWGVSNYYSQEVPYDLHKGFIDICNNVITDKIKKREEEN